MLYRDEIGKETKRTVKPIAIIYYVSVIVLVAWCELRRDFRHFRLDRILSCEQGVGSFQNEGNHLRKEWELLQNSRVSSLG